VTPAHRFAWSVGRRSYWSNFRWLDGAMGLLGSDEDRSTPAAALASHIWQMQPHRRQGRLPLLLTVRPEAGPGRAEDVSCAMNSERVRTAQVDNRGHLRTRRSRSTSSESDQRIVTP
jgi:hypothetical protein